MVIPPKDQWKKWTLPSKYSYVGVVLGAIGVLISVVGLLNPSSFLFPSNDGQSTTEAQSEQTRSEFRHHLLTATGYGKAPARTKSKRERRYLALLAARNAAKRDLTAYINGTMVKSVTVVSNHEVDQDSIVSSVEGKVPAFSTIEEVYDEIREEAQVTLQIMVREND